MTETERKLKACKKALLRCKKEHGEATLAIDHDKCVMVLVKLKLDLEGIFETEF